MRLAFSCPSCQGVVIIQNVEDHPEIKCTHCSWKKKTPLDKIVDEKPECCLICGCEDLWRQKDFPVSLGLTMVGLGIILSTWFYANYRPVLALSVLMFFALVDMVLFLFMKDVLVCYRCASRHRNPAITNADPAFNLEIAERYRQESIREKEISPEKPANHN